MFPPRLACAAHQKSIRAVCRSGWLEEKFYDLSCLPLPLPLSQSRKDTSNSHIWNWCNILVHFPPPPNNEKKIRTFFFLRGRVLHTQFVLGFCRFKTLKNGLVTSKPGILCKIFLLNLFFLYITIFFHNMFCNKNNNCLATSILLSLSPPPTSPLPLQNTS